MGRLRRGWQERNPRERLELRERDMEILQSVLDYRFLTSTQLQKKFFSSKSFADRRLRKLYDHGMLERIMRPVSQGKCEVLYCLAGAGARRLAKKLGKSGPELGWKSRQDRIGPEFLEHHLALNQFRFSLEGAVEGRDGFDLVRWNSRVKLSIRPGKSLCPDALFILRTPRGRAFFFLEIDLATETAGRTFKKKMEQYQAYRMSGRFAAEYGAENFRVLVITTSPARIGSLVRAAGRLQAKILFWLTTFHAVSEETPLVDIWIRADRPGQRAAL